jgi:hypothetical protein
MKKLLFGALCFLLICFSGIMLADVPAAPFAYVATSPSGKFYFEMVPPQWENGALKNNGFGVACRLLRDGSNKEMWRTDNWYSFEVFLSEDGNYLVRMEPSILGHEPSKDDLAIAFYKNGSLLKQYSTADLVKDKTKVVATVSYYRWQASDVEREKKIASGANIKDELAEPRLLWMDNTFRLKTCDDIVYVFDIATGNIKSSNPVTAGNQ